MSPSPPATPTRLEQIAHFALPFGHLAVSRGPDGEEWVQYVWEEGYLAAARAQDVFARTALRYAELRHPALALPHVCRGADGGPAGLAYSLVAGDPRRWRTLEQLARHWDGTILNVHLVDILRRLCDAILAVHRFLGRTSPDAAGHGLLLPLSLLVHEDYTLRLGGLGLAEALRLTEPSLPAALAAARDQSSYLAPEVRLGHQPPGRPAADVYSIGALIFLLATNEDPLGASHELRALNLHASELTDRILRRCLDPSPDHRFPGPEGIVRALDTGSLLGEESQPANIPFARGEALLTPDVGSAAGSAAAGASAGRASAAGSGAEGGRAAVWELPPLDRGVMLRAATPAAPRAVPALLSGAPALRLIPAGPYLQGSPRGELDERPLRIAYLHAYYLATTPVTVAQFQAFLEEAGDDDQALMIVNHHALIGRRLFRRGWVHAPEVAEYPVNNVTYDGAVAYARWLSARTAQPWRLPTEAEWERATQEGWGGRPRLYPWGDDHPTPLVACYGRSWENKGIETLVPVERLPASASPHGILQMAGNVWEWCSDYYDQQAYRAGDQVDPQGPPTGYQRVLRGGCWRSGPHDLRCTRRRGQPPVPTGAEAIGFRLALTLPDRWVREASAAALAAGEGPAPPLEERPRDAAPEPPR